MTIEGKTLGQLIAERRQELGMKLHQIAKLVHNEHGGTILEPYLSNLEHDRVRRLSPLIIGQLEVILGFPKTYLLAAGGLPIPDIAQYHSAHPDMATKVADMFKRARQLGANQQTWFAAAAIIGGPSEPPPASALYATPLRSAVE